MAKPAVAWFEMGRHSVSTDRLLAAAYTVGLA
jgi:hypothetical protein